MRRKRRQSTAEQYDLDRGTKQTQKRLKGESAIDRLIRSGAVNPDMERASLEISRVWHANTRRLMVKTSSMADRIDCSTAGGIPGHLVDAYLVRYIPWCDALKTLKPPKGNRPVNAHDIIIDVVVWDYSLAEMDAKHKRYKGFAKHITIGGLRLYADLAQWGRVRPIEQYENTG